MRKILIYCLVTFMPFAVWAQQKATEKGRHGTDHAYFGKYFQVNSLYNSSDAIKMKFWGVVGNRLQNNMEQWELPAPDANPAMTEMFFDRDRQPARDLLPWSGEFVGKYLSSAVLSYRILKDPRQEKVIKRVVADLLRSQGDDGYLGPYDKSNKLVGRNWDLWGHYWAIKGLLLYYDEFGDESAFTAALSAGDLITKKFLNKDFQFINDDHNGACNYSVIHAFTDLYGRTGKEHYKEMAKWVVKKWDSPESNQYLTKALDGVYMHELPNRGNRWESIHNLLGMYEMYFITADEKYLKAFTHLWKGIQMFDRHNNGGFSTDEGAKGNPYLSGPIETCCTIAWIDMSVCMLKIAGDSKIADELELSLYNGLLGGQHPTGRWWTYNTPMNGTKEASAHTINFQCRPGSPELNCCSVNGPRGIGLLSEWALLTDKESVTVNFYGASSFDLLTPQKQPLLITQETDYPRSGVVSLTVEPGRAEEFKINLRIPSWSSKTSVKVNGVLQKGYVSGTYLQIKRMWRSGDKIDIVFDMSPHYWLGEKEMQGKASVYYGPILLAFDFRYNDSFSKVAEIPAIDAKSFNLKPLDIHQKFDPWVLFSAKTNDGKEIVLCDYATAGVYGNYFQSWFSIKQLDTLSTKNKSLIWNNRNFK